MSGVRLRGQVVKFLFIPDFRHLLPSCDVVRSGSPEARDGVPCPLNVDEELETSVWVA